MPTISRHRPFGVTTYQGPAYVTRPGSDLLMLSVAEALEVISQRVLGIDITRMENALRDAAYRREALQSHQMHDAG